MKNVMNFEASKPDPRVLIFQAVAVCLLSFVNGSRIELFILFALLDILMLFQNMVSAAVRFAAYYAVLLALNALLWFLQIPLISMMFSMMILLCFRLIPICMASVILLEKAPMNELLISLEHMRIPKMMIIPLSVVYRYVPTVKHEIRYVRESMKMRGLNTSLTGMLLHPMTAIENFMIPLLIRSGKLADELSAAALCKGLDIEHKKTSCTEVRFQKSDAAYCALCTVAAGLLILIHYSDFFKI
jgi:energy-coupling factor transport system permease protein